jgi:hypothetical protein
MTSTCCPEQHNFLWNTSQTQTTLSVSGYWTADAWIHYMSQGRDAFIANEKIVRSFADRIGLDTRVLEQVALLWSDTCYGETKQLQCRPVKTWSEILRLRARSLTFALQGQVVMAPILYPANLRFDSTHWYVIVTENFVLFFGILG